MWLWIVGHLCRNVRDWNVKLWIVSHTCSLRWWRWHWPWVPIGFRPLSFTLEIFISKFYYEIHIMWLPYMQIAPYFIGEFCKLKPVLYCEIFTWLVFSKNFKIKISCVEGALAVPICIFHLCGPVFVVRCSHIFILWFIIFVHTQNHRCKKCWRKNKNVKNCDVPNVQCSRRY